MTTRITLFIDRLKKISWGASLLLLLHTAQAAPLSEAERWSEASPPANVTQTASATIDANNVRRRAEAAGHLSSIPQDAPPHKVLSQAMLFVSFSMPDRLLKQYLKEAHRLGIPLVLRGLVNNNFQATATRIFNLTKQTKMGGLTIDPRAFERFDIQTVPTLVVMATPLACEKKRCETPAFDRLGGNLSLTEALKWIAHEGEAAPDIAAGMLAHEALLQAERRQTEQTGGEDA